MPGLTKNPSKRNGEKVEEVKAKKEKKVGLKVENKKKIVSSVGKITRKKNDSTIDKEELQVKPVEVKKEVTTNKVPKVVAKKQTVSKITRKKNDNKEDLQVKPVAAKTKKEVTSKKIPKVVAKKQTPSSVSKISRKKKDSTNDNKDEPVEPVKPTKKKVTSKKDSKVVKKEKSGDPSTSTEAEKMGKVLNGSLSEKKTGDIYIGYHASIAGGIENALIDSVSAGARCLALFLGSQRTWASHPLKQENIQQFRKIREENQILPNMILPHGSYLLNLGSPNPELRQKSLDLLVDELERCEALGILLFNIHPGKPKLFQ